MPIGKNAIKRVANNGYSSVKTSAPDMENSVVAELNTEEATAAEKPVQEVKGQASFKTAKEAPRAEAKGAPRAKAPKKAPTKKAAPKKSMEAEPTLSPVNTASAVVGKKDEEGARAGDGYVNLGGELPYYLL